MAVIGMGSRNRRRGLGQARPNSTNMKAQTTSCLTGFLVLGLVVGLYGPALPTLKEHLRGVSYNILGAVFAARTCGGLVGAAIAGYLLETLAEANWLLGMGMVVAGLASSIVPVVTRLSELALLVFVMDLGLALVVASGSTLCSWANRPNPTMSLNLLNGAFGVGAFLSPLLVLVMERSYASSWQGLQMSFWSVALCCVCMGIATFTVKSPPNPNVSDPREGKRRALGLGWPLSDSSVMLSPRVPGTSEPPLPQVDKERTAVEPLTAVYVMLVAGVTTSFGTFVVPYAQDYLKMRNVETYALDSAFWVAFTASRFAWAAASRLVPPHYLIGLEMGCMLLSCMLMTMVETHWMLWVGAVGFGVGVSGCFAAAVSQLQAYMGMTGRTGAWVAAGATSGTLVQLVTSQVAERPKLIVHCITVFTAASVAVMGSIWALHRPPVTPEVDPDGQQVAGRGEMMTEGSPLQPRSHRGSSSWLAEYGAVDTSQAVVPAAAASTAAEGFWRAEGFAGFEPGVAPLDTDRGDEDNDDGEEHGAWAPMAASRREMEQSAATDLHLLLLADTQSEGTTGELVV